MKENANKEFYVLGKFALAAGAITAILFYVFGDELLDGELQSGVTAN